MVASMGLSSFSSKAIIGDRPKMEFNKPKIGADGRWLLSGKMIVKFKPGPAVLVDELDRESDKGLQLAIPFADAKDEQDALAQAAKALQQIGKEIQEAASDLATRAGPQYSQT
jgi:hypothetical protein